MYIFAKKVQIREPNFTHQVFKNVLERLLKRVYFLFFNTKQNRLRFLALLSGEFVEMELLFQFMCNSNNKI